MVMTTKKPKLEKQESQGPRIFRFRLMVGTHFEKYDGSVPGLPGKQTKNEDGTVTTEIEEVKYEARKNAVIRTTRNLQRVYGVFDDYFPNLNADGKVISYGKFIPDTKKFRRLPDEPQAFEEDEEIQIEDPEEIAALEPAKPKSWGKDVTEQFQMAAELEYKVYRRKDKLFDVYNDDHVLINAKPLKKHQIDACINEYLHEANEEELNPETEE